MPHGGKRPGAGRPKGSRSKPTEARLSKCAGPIADYLDGVLAEKSRSAEDHIRAAFGLQTIAHFLPDASIPSDGYKIPLPGPDDPGSGASDVVCFSGLTAAEEEIAQQSATLVDDFVAASTIGLASDSKGLVLMEVTAQLVAGMYRRAQATAIGQLDADAAKQSMHDLIYERSQELLRPHDMALN